MEIIKRILGREPAYWTALVYAGVLVVSGLIYPLSTDQQGGVNAIAAAVLGLVTAYAVARDGLQAALIGFFKAALALLISFGLHMSPENQNALMMLVAAASAIVIRNNSTAPIQADGSKAPEATIVPSNKEGATPAPLQ